MKLTAKRRRELERQAREERAANGLPAISFSKVFYAMSPEQQNDLMRQLFPTRAGTSKEGDGH